MTNYEKHKELVLECIKLANTCKLGEKVFDTSECSNRTCSDCRQRIINWLMDEYVPSIDWSKVAKNTPIVVTKEGCQVRAHFAFYEPNYITFYDDGKTSWTGGNKLYTVPERNVKLARDEDIEKYSI